MAIEVGQIWREVDPRFDRFVRIEEVGPHQIGLRTMIHDGKRWIAAPRSRAAVTSPTRFNGKRGGYELVEERM